MSLDWRSTLDDVDWHELEDLYREALGPKPADALRTAFAASRYRWFVREHGRLIGAGRAIADGVFVAYLCDIAVRPAHQGRGLGRAIVERLMADAAGHPKVILYAVPGKEPFYRRLGFRRLLTGMAVFADEAQAIARGHLEADLDPRTSTSGGAATARVRHDAGISAPE